MNKINIGNRYQMEFHFDDGLCQLDNESVIINLYRMIQEQFKNIVKHAHAKRIAVTLAARDNLLTLTIEDDGCGFDPREGGKGIGLNNIKKRIESLSGKYILRTAPGKGCAIIAELPM